MANCWGFWKENWMEWTKENIQIKMAKCQMNNNKYIGYVYILPVILFQLPPHNH